MSPVRHDWYQSDSKVVIDVLVKNANNRNCTVEIKPNEVRIRGDDDLELDLQLAHEVDVSKSSYRISSVKIEITLQKLAGERWTSLVKKDGEIATAIPSSFMPSSTASANTTAMVNQKGKNWDRVVKEAWETEQIEKEEAKQINSLFEKIYADSSPEVRRAMNKSFTESGGTVLSTNWKEVAEKKVEVKPPTGTEFRPWDQ